MENIIPFTLFGSGIAFGLLVGLLFIVLIVSDLNETGEIAFVAFVVAVGLNYFWGTFPFFSVAISVRNILIYIFIGFIFSLVRTYFKGKKLSPDAKKYFNLKHHVFRWWFLFPISAITWIFGDLLKDLYDLLYYKISRVYESIFNA